MGREEVREGEGEEGEGEERFFKFTFACHRNTFASAHRLSFSFFLTFRSYHRISLALWHSSI